MIQCNAYQDNIKNQDNNQADHFRPRSCLPLMTKSAEEKFTKSVEKIETITKIDTI